jgi:hypothetical protein
MKSKTIGRWMLVILILCSGLSLTPSAKAAPTVKIGDYFRFGKLYDTPILWRVIHLDGSGDALLFADRILTLKAYDSRGVFHKNPQRRAKGSNYWPNSNIRQWLNSSSANKGNTRMDWLQNDPTKQNMLNGNNAFASEKGFLADGNFTATERNAIKPVSNKVLLAAVDASQKEGGTEVHMSNNKLAHILTNVNKAYYKNVTDRVFLLTAQQIKSYIYDRRKVLGENYHIAKPTTAAVKNSTYKNPVFLNANLPWYYWLNSPSASTPDDVRFVFSSGGIGSNVAALDNSGIRPALYLKTKSVSFASGGKGTSSQPYVVTGSSTPVPDKQPPSVPTNLQFTNMSGSNLTVKWNVAKDNVAIKSYEIYVNKKLVASTTNNSYQFTNLNTSSPISVNIRAIDRAGNKSAFSQLISTGQTIQLVGNQLYVNFKRIELGAKALPIKRNGQLLVPARSTLQALGLKVKWNEAKKQLSATKTGFTMMITVGSKTAVVNNKVNKVMTIAPMEVNGYVMIPLSFVSSQLGYKLHVK